MGYRLFACLTNTGVPAHEGGIEIAFAGTRVPAGKIPGDIIISDTQKGVSHADRKITLNGLRVTETETHATNERVGGQTSTEIASHVYQIVRLQWDQVIAGSAAFSHLKYDDHHLPEAPVGIANELGFTFDEGKDVTEEVKKLSEAPTIEPLSANKRKPFLACRKTYKLFSFSTPRTKQLSWTTILLRQIATARFGMTCVFTDGRAESAPLYTFDWHSSTKDSRIYVEELFGAFIHTPWKGPAMAEKNDASWGFTRAEELGMNWNLCNPDEGKGKSGHHTVERITFRAG